MAFATKYRIQFKDVEETTWYVDLQYDGFSGSVTSLVPGPNPALLRYNPGDRFDCIASSSLDIQVQYSSTVESILVADERTVRVHVFTASNNYWYGYLVPNQYSRRLTSKPQFSTFTATDQLRMLEDVKFEDSSGDPYYYLATDLTVLSNLFTKTGFALSTKEGVNIYETNFSSGVTNSPISQTYFFREMYWNTSNDERDNCYNVLYDILRKYGARVFQSEIQWYLQRPNTMWSKHPVRTFTAADPMVYLSNSVDYVRWNRSDSSGVWFADPEITKKPRVGIVEVTADPGRKENLVKNPTFDDFTQSGGSPRYWSGSADVSVSDGYVTINDVDGAGDPSVSLYTDFHVKNLTTGNIILDIEPTYSGGTDCILHFGLSGTTETRWCKLQGFTGDYPDWANSESHYELDVDANGLDGVRFILTIPFHSDPLNPQTTYRLHLFEVEDGGTTTASCKVYGVRVEPSYGSHIPQNEIARQTNPTSAYHIIRRGKSRNIIKYDRSEVGLKMCDSFYPLTNGEEGMFWCLRYGTGNTETTGDWYIKGHADTVGTNVSIQTLLAKQMLEAYYNPIDVLSGTLRYTTSSYYQYYKSLVEDDIVDTYGFAKTFVPLDVEWNIHRMTWSGTWEEVAPVYNDESIEWSSHDYGGDGSIVGDTITIDFTITGADEEGVSDAYTAVAAENVRVVVTLTDNGSSDLPNIIIRHSVDGDTAQTVTWGTNYLEYYSASAGDITIVIGGDLGDALDLDAEITFYSLTGI